MFSKKLLIRLVQPLDMFSSMFQRRKVSFVIAGAQKCGTSALAGYLSTHHQVCMGKDRKEIHFFDGEKVRNLGPFKNFLYHSFFRIKPWHRVIGEGTPEYMWWFDAPKRIWEYNPDMKIIIILRNPVDRAFSHWKMMRKRGEDDTSFWDAITTEEARCRAALPYQHRHYSYISRGFFSEQIRRIWHYFPREQTLILKMEDLRDEPEFTLKKVTDFLEVEPFDNFRERKIRSKPKESHKMTSKEREYLLEIFKYEILELEQMLRWNCESWSK